MVGWSATFDARVHAIDRSQLPEQLNLELRVQDVTIKATMMKPTSTWQVVPWEEAQQLTPESIVRVAETPFYKAGTTETSYTTTDPIDLSSLEVLAYAPASPTRPLDNQDSGTTPVLDKRNAASHAISKLHSGFTDLDMVMAFDNDYHEIVGLVELMVLFVFTELEEREPYRQLVEVVRRHYPSAKPFQLGIDEDCKVRRTTFLGAKRILREKVGGETDDDKNFTDREEVLLGQHFRTSPNFGETDMFTIDQYPAHLQPFNSQKSPNAPGLTNTWNIISLRGPPMDPGEEKWRAYLDDFKAGMPKHGACGLGVDRMLQTFLGLDSVHEVLLSQTG
ncbi:hypothetical protein OQA88_9178 [Cercophora sp. LCS_1]